jgi:ribose transport system ATP-binding protein
LKLGKLNLKKESQLSQQMVNVLQIKTPSLSQKVRLLSGGNQQKVVLAKWLLKECDIIIFDEPTRGIDVGAKFEIYKLIIDLARNGVAIIMVSSELPEILGMSDRIMVMSRGQIAGELTREEADQVKILQYATRRNE